MSTPAPPDVLARILATKHEEVAQRSAARPLAAVRADALVQAAPRGFARALQDGQPPARLQSSPK